MSQIREVVARMAVDPAFAEQVRSHPDEVARAYGLNPDEIDKLRGLAEADAQSGPSALGPRLSKSGITGGLLAGFLAGAADPMAAAEGGDVSKADWVAFDPQPDPPGGPHVAEAALGGPDTQPADGSDDGGIIIDWTPDPDAFDYGIPDTQPDPGEAGARGIIVYDMPDPADGAYDGPDIQPGGDSDASGEARGIIIHAAPDPESADANVQEVAITKVSDGVDAGDASIIDDGKLPADAQGDAMIIDDGDAPGLEPPEVEIKSSVKLPSPTLGSDPNDTHII